MMKPNENVLGLICCNLLLSHLHFLEIRGLAGNKKSKSRINLPIFPKEPGSQR